MPAGIASGTVTGDVCDVPELSPLNDQSIVAMPMLSDAEIVALAPARPAMVAGASILTTGGVESRVTMTVVCDVRPKMSVAVTMMWLSPSVSGTPAEKLGPPFVASIPLTDTDMSARSDTSPVTEIPVAFVSVPGCGDVID